MGDMADFALEQVYEEEAFRAAAYYREGAAYQDYLEEYGEEPDIPCPQLDLGCFDRDGLDIELAYLPFLFTTDTTHQAVVTRSVPQRGFQNPPSKHLKKAQMLVGMAETIILKDRPLSEKQAHWLETNWKGGSVKFIEDCQSENKMQLLQTLRRIEAFLNK